MTGKSSPVAKRLQQASLTPTGRVRSPRMLERSANTRALILRSAARVIGRHGYAGCTVARLTATARIAHGTFYLYFSSQQHLFDQLLPEMANAALAVIREAVKDAQSVYELEELGLRANFAHLTKYPYLYRVTSEAEIYAPETFEAYTSMINRRYSRALRRLLHGSSAVDEATAQRYDEVAAMLEGARTQLLKRFGLKHHKVTGLPDHAMQTYLAFVRAGIEAALGKG